MADIRPSEIIQTFRPIWRKIPETAHFRALAYKEMPGFINRLTCLRPTPARLCLAFLILTACRSKEARLAGWEEIADTQWMIPAPRTKMRKPHVVPLSNAAKAILELANGLSHHHRSELIFPSEGSEALSDMAMAKILRDMGVAGRATVHGFRSTFRTWCAEVAKSRPEVAEAALAHRVRDKTEAAYLEERHGLMEAWADPLCRAGPKST